MRLLRKAGHDAVGFVSVTGALDALEPGTKGCLVFDSETVGPTTADLRAELKRRGPQLPIIVVSATDDHRTRRNARDLRAVGLYRKPVDGPALSVRSC